MRHVEKVETGEISRGGASSLHLIIQLNLDQYIPSSDPRLVFTATVASTASRSFAATIKSASVHHYID